MAEESFLRQRRQNDVTTSDQHVLRKPEFREQQDETLSSDSGFYSYDNSETLVPLHSTFRKNIEIRERPRQVACASVMIGGVAFASLLYDEADEPDVLIRRGLFTTLWVICWYTAVQMRDGAMIRPHPAFWRMIHGIALWYLIILPIFAILPLHTAKAIIRELAPELKQEADSVIGHDHLNCDLNWTNLSWHLTSFWTFYHALGWFLKMMVFRNWITCIAVATLFEFMELTLQFAIPEFQECWWDSMILDWGVANILGMAVGSLALKCMTCIEYSWTPWKEVHGAGPLFKRWLQQFLPYYWVNYRWDESQTIRNYLLQCMMVVVGVLVEMNTFLINITLKITSSHMLTGLRCSMMILVAIPAIHEWHLYVTGAEARIGYNIWTLIIILVLELSICIKYSLSIGIWERAMIETPAGVLWSWTGFLLLQFIYIVLHLKLQRNAAKYEKQWKIPRWLRFFRFSSIVPLLWLTRYYAF
eukprot:GEMP01042787.1.p1 GENE.GEMP01042787.1~~GEMP01042787.1.p1  ORF type:complete len:474 (+),score=21.71 GEMP01042787.1:86-1507(+)